jgi:aminoglycoside phosphotransferase (APT) family kinase protein
VIHSLSKGGRVFYSNRLGDVPDSSLQEALACFDLGTLISTKRIRFGLFGQNLFVSSTSGEYVFRGAPHYAWQLPCERHFAWHIHRDTGLPVPWPYHVSTDSGPFPWPWGFALMPRLPGQLLADAGVYGAFSPRVRTNLARAQGMLLWNLQEATYTEAGIWDMALGGNRPFPAGYVRRTIDRALASGRSAFGSGGHSRVEQEWLESLLESFMDLPEPSNYAIVHEDFNRNNMTAVLRGDDVEITGLFDLMTCHLGDGLADLARQFSIFLSEPEGDHLAQTYIHSYLEHGDRLDDVALRRSVLYLIDERLLAWEFAKRPGHEGLNWWDPGLTLREWLGSYLEAWRDISRS